MTSRKASLAETHPELAAQADGWDPKEVPYSSNKKVGWRCKSGHTWDAIMGNRGKGSGCPICANKSVLAGFNDLATTHPELAAQADGWDPTKVSFGNGKKHRWRCDAGHLWEISPNARSNRKSGCPICAGQQVLVGFNDLSTTYPEIAKEAFGWDPKTRTAGSSRSKVKWQCSLGHVWEAVVSDRTLGGNGCAVCSGRQINVGFNDLATIDPKIGSEAYGWDPRTVTVGSEKKKQWQCKHGHIWSATVVSRVSGRGCPVCAGKVVVAGFNDLATTHPEIIFEVDGWDPTKVSFGNGRKHRWKCKSGHSWEVSPNQRTNQGHGCPICSGNKVLKGFNDLASRFPEIAKEAFNWDPSSVTGKSNIDREWICSFGHKWKAAPANRAAGTGCPICDNDRVLVGFNDLATTHPELARQADGWDPTTVVAGSNKRFVWKCQLGHLWKTSVAKRSDLNNPTGCPTCSNQQLLVGFNDLATTHPELATEADGWNPTVVVAGSNKSFQWKCKLGHVWKSTINNRKQGKSCPYCTGRRVLVGFNDLATTHPDLAAQATGWDPTTVSAGSRRRLRWQCAVGHIWGAEIANRTKKDQTGCPSCAKYGFDPNKKSWMYFLEHYEMDMLQIGITNNLKRRLDEHAKGSWEVIEIRGPMDGHLTQKLETDCLHVLEKRGAILGHKAGIKKFDGYSEAWTKQSLNVTSIKQILDWVYEDDINPN